MLRRLLSRSAGMLLLGALALGAWLTRHPESELLERATEWPVIGASAARFRQIYLPPEPSPPVDEPAEIVYVDPRGRPLEDGRPGGANPDRTLGAKPVVWVEEDTPVMATPEPGAAELARTGGLANLRILERRGDWFQVLYRGEAGWVYNDDYRESEVPPLGSEPLPPTPLSALPPDEERLARIAELMPDAVRGELGPYDAYWRGADPELVAFLDRLVRSIEPAYVARYGVAPVGEPAGAIVLFDRRDGFQVYQGYELPIHGLEAAGVTGGGIVALDVEGRHRAEIAATVIHEIVHVLNRRALGPALPPWLEEGLADDLAHSAIASDGRLDSRRLGGLSLRRPNGWEWRGAMASAVSLRRALDGGRLTPLERLVNLDWEDFVGRAASEDHYAQASFWIRHLLSDPATLGVFRGFLAGVANGASAEGEELRRRLGAEWPVLDDRYRSWIRIRFHDPTPT